MEKTTSNIFKVLLKNHFWNRKLLQYVKITDKRSARNKTTSMFKITIKIRTE
jgi:hypothetical protein